MTKYPDLWLCMAEEILGIYSNVSLSLEMCTAVFPLQYNFLKQCRTDALYIYIQTHPSLLQMDRKQDWCTLFWFLEFHLSSYCGVMAKSHGQPGGWSCIIQAVNTEDQGFCLDPFFSPRPSHLAFWRRLIDQPGLAICQNGWGAKRAAVRGIRCLWEADLQGCEVARCQTGLDSGGMPQHFALSECTPTSRLMEISLFASVHVE